MDATHHSSAWRVRERNGTAPLHLQIESVGLWVKLSLIYKVPHVRTIRLDTERSHRHAY